MRNDWLRWTVPPGVSLAVHAALIGAVAYVGMRISAQQTPSSRLPVAELALPAPPELPEQADPQPITPQTGANAPRVAPSAPETLPDEVQAQAARLGAREYTAPRMAPVAQASVRQSSAQIARPESAAPPSVRFAGVQSRAARTIVYVVDGSGATANSFAYLQSQLMQSIDRLSPTQKFQVVLFRAYDQHTISLAPIGGGKLARANPGGKQAVSDWLSATATRGRSNPVDGLKAALALKPDLVLLITRSIQRTEMGWAQGQREILAQLDALNPAHEITGRRDTVIKTIQLLDEDPTGIMRAIGTIHGDGQDDYRVVTYDDLVTPDEGQDTATASIGASDEQRIVAGAEILTGLAETGASFGVLYTVFDQSQRQSAIESARRVRALVGPLRDVDGRAALLDAQALLLARCADPESESGSVSDELLRQSVQSLAGRMYTDADTDAQRVLTLAHALVLLGDAPSAIDQVRSLLANAQELGLSRSARAQALLALVSWGHEPEDLRRLASEPPFVTASGAIDAVWGLLLREATTRARLAKGEASAWGPMLGVREAAKGSEAIRGYIDSRIALLYAQQRPDADLSTPSPVLLASAQAMGRQLANRERALGLLGVVASREDEPELAAEALWEMGVLGRAIGEEASIAISNRALTELARRYPDDPRAAGALASAIGADDRDDDASRRERLAYAVRAYPDHAQIDLWRLELAELLEDFTRLDALDPVTAGTREGVLAGELYERTVLAMLERYDDPQIRRGLGVRMRDAAARFAMPTAALWTKRAALSEVELDPQSALASIDQLISEARAQQRPTTELELMRAQTLLKLGQQKTAFAALRELSGRIDAMGARTSTYWQAWALMLESIARNGNTANRDDARRHIARLELIDPRLGGSPWRERITRAKESLHSTP